MGHVSLVDILIPAREGKYGIPNLWGGSVEKVIGHITAAENRNSPLILCYNHGLCPQLPVEVGVPLIVHAAEHARVPVATILDHGSDMDMILKAIEHGVSSVMFDGSSLPYEDNVFQTRNVARTAHSRGVSVEGELGAVGGSAIETGGYSDVKGVMTDPDQARDFVERTGVDALAISFGNVHGQYRAAPNLDLDRVRRTAELVSIPLVMHGASGLSESDYPRVIASGISKINYYTAMAQKAAQNIKTKAAKSCVDLVCHNIISWNIEFYKKETQDLLDLLGCSGKARAEVGGPSPVDLADVLVVEISKAVAEVLSRKQLDSSI
jgi:fructose-bisphosphate aldolase class II